MLLLGSAAGGSEEELAAIHGPRLERLMEHLVETPVRGVVYEGTEAAEPRSCELPTRGAPGGSRSDVIESAQPRMADGDAARGETSWLAGEPK